jgi:hypothetical protein
LFFIATQPVLRTTIAAAAATKQVKKSHYDKRLQLPTSCILTAQRAQPCQAQQGPRNNRLPYYIITNHGAHHADDQWQWLCVLESMPAGTLSTQEREQKPQHMTHQTK